MIPRTARVRVQIDSGAVELALLHATEYHDLMRLHQRHWEDLRDLDRWQGVQRAKKRALDVLWRATMETLCSQSRSS